MSRTKLFFGAIAIALTTVVLMTVGMFYALGMNYKDLGSTFRLLRAVYVIKSQHIEYVPNDVLITGALKGIVASLGDPHSIYLDAKMLTDLKDGMKGSFGGVGIVLGMKDKSLMVISPIEGSPGEQAGIKSGDTIVKINGIETLTMAIDEAAAKIRGPEGTKVVLTIQRAEEVQDYVVYRSNIQIKTVGSKMLDNNIGYIRIAVFNEHTAEEFAKNYAELEKAGMKKVVLDLRDNPGGLLNECVKVAGYFVPKGPVVSVVRRNGDREVSRSKLEAVKYPCVVLINGGSASASEIVAGAIQDTGAGTLIGEKSYGKGTVQVIKPLDLDTGLKITSAKYYTPSDRSIHGTGIEPDINLPMATRKPGVRSDDIQLNKAIEVLKNGNNN